MIDHTISLYGSKLKDTAKIYARKYMVIFFLKLQYNVVEKPLQNSYNLVCQWKTQLNIF